MRQNRHTFLAFPKFYKALSIFPQRQKHAGVILRFGESDWLDWSSDKDDTLGLA